jgi:precorrin-3B synthase
MNALAAEVKGWCPGALRPMPSGDGLIVRIRPFCSTLDLGQARGLAELAARLGNGHIDLTRRANLQIRGLSEETLPELHARLDQLGLIDRDAEIEATRNLMVGPLAGLDPGTIDVRPTAQAIAATLAADRLTLPAKFGLLVDGGGTASIAAERADISLLAMDEDVALGIDTPSGTRWLGVTSAADAADVTTLALHAFLDASGGRARLRLRDLPADRVTHMISFLRSKLRGRVIVSPKAGRPLGALGAIVGVAAPFGRLEASQLGGLISMAADAGAAELRLSPWRSCYFGARSEAAARSVVARASRLGLIVEAGDPILRLAACPGTPDCRSSSVDTRRDARRLAALAARHDFVGSIHVSGCSKGCARSDPSDLVLIGDAGRYRVARNATTRFAGGHVVAPDDFPALMQGVRDG